jgi:hypothetical protein
MNAREHAEELRQQAIAELLAERDAIDAQLKSLGYGQEIKTSTNRRGRPPKTTPSAIPETHQEQANEVGPASATGLSSPADGPVNVSVPFQSPPSTMRGHTLHNDG